METTAPTTASFECKAKRIPDRDWVEITHVTEGEGITTNIYMFETKDLSSQEQVLRAFTLFCIGLKFITPKGISPQCSALLYQCGREHARKVTKKHFLVSCSSAPDALGYYALTVQEAK
jgi:hypothetical protein